MQLNGKNQRKFTQTTTIGVHCQSSSKWVEICIQCPRIDMILPSASIVYASSKWSENLARLEAHGAQKKVGWTTVVSITNMSSSKLISNIVWDLWLKNLFHCIWFCYPIGTCSWQPLTMSLNVWYRPTKCKIHFGVNPASTPMLG